MRPDDLFTLNKSAKVKHELFLSRSPSGKLIENFCQTGKKKDNLLFADLFWCDVLEKPSDDSNSGALHVTLTVPSPSRCINGWWQIVEAALHNAVQ